MRVTEIITEDVGQNFQLNEDVSDWINKKINKLIATYIGVYRKDPHAKPIAPNLPDDVADKMVADYMQRAEAQRLAQEAAKAQRTTVEDIQSILIHFVNEFVRRWKQIPADVRANAWKNLAYSILRLIEFILVALAKSKK